MPVLAFLALLVQVQAIRLANLSPQLLKGSMINPRGEQTSFQIAPFGSIDSVADIASVTWATNSYNGTRVFAKEQMPLVALVSVPMKAAAGGTVLDGKARSRISQGTTIIKDGAMWRVTTVYDTNNDLGFSELYWQQSKDDGLTFSALTRVYIKGVQDESNSKKASIPSLLGLDDGTLILGFLITVGRTDTYWVSISKDGGKTFSETQQISDVQGQYYDPAHDRMVLLPSGRIVIPMNLHPCPDCIGYCFVFYSNDRGATWKKSANVDFGNNTCEQPAVQPIDNNTLLMLGRSKTGFAMASISPDQGLTWTKAVTTNFSTPFASVSLKSIAGSLYALYNQGSKRQNLTMARMISKSQFNLFAEVLTFTGSITASIYPSHQYPTAEVTSSGRRLFLNYWGATSTVQDDVYQLLDIRAIGLSSQSD